MATMARVAANSTVFSGVMFSLPDGEEAMGVIGTLRFSPDGDVRQGFDEWVRDHFAEPPAGYYRDEFHVECRDDARKVHFRIIDRKMR